MMDNVKFAIVDGSKTIETELGCLDQTNKRAVIDGIFGMFGVNPSPVSGPLRAPKPPAPEPAAPKAERKEHVPPITITLEEDPAEVHVDEVKQKPAVYEIEIPKTGRPRQLPLSGSRSEINPLGEKLQAAMEKKDEPDFWQTGIKYRGETPLYRTHYKCACGNKGRQYIEEGTPFAECHQCATPLKVRAAGEGGFPNRDGWGNFYVASFVEDDHGTA